MSIVGNCMFTRWMGPKSIIEHATHVLAAYRASLPSIWAQQVFYHFMSWGYNSLWFCFSLGRVVNYCMCIVNNVTLVDQTRAIHGLGRVGFGPNLDSTRRRRVEGGGTRNQLSEKSVESVLGEDEHRSVRLVAGVKKIIKIWEKKTLSESGKSCWNMENLPGIWKILLVSTFCFRWN